MLNIVPTQSTAPSSTSTSSTTKTTSRKPRRKVAPKATTHDHFQPVLTEFDLECERMGAKLRATVNLEALAADIPEAFGPLSVRAERVAWGLAAAALDLYDTSFGGRAATQRIAGAMQLPRDEFEASLDVVCPESGIGWDLEKLTARYPGVADCELARRITQLRSSYMGGVEWHPELHGGANQSQIVNVSSWLDEAAFFRGREGSGCAHLEGRSKVEVAAVDLCVATGAPVIVDTHVHAWPIDMGDGWRRVVFIADALQLLENNAVMTLAGGQLPTLRRPAKKPARKSRKAS